MGEQTTTERRDFFLSYTRADTETAQWIAWELENAGYTVLFQAWDMVPGSNWLRLVHQASRHAERTIAVLSAAYLRDSEFGEAEWLAAYQRDPRGLAGRVIPIRIEECVVDGLLAGVVHADLFDLPDRDAFRARLLSAVEAARSGRAKPLTEPPFPPGIVRGGAPGPPPPESPMPGTRSGYLMQIRQISPRALLDRQKELDALAAFCRDPAAGSYVWWRAAAWTGKSALMSWFVLHPPPGTRVASFFVTARYAGNSDRNAFLGVLIEQLSEVLGESVPPFQSESGQERLWFRLLDATAEHCARRGERLIVLVDGLDEDTSTPTSRATRSIAALLPANPPPGLRVVVAGRPDPPIPADVPPNHPLRDPDIVRILRRSPHASAIRADMQADLDRLRNGSLLERDLLGLVTAARGGLSGHDLAELCADHETTEWDIERLLSTVAGRSFTARAARWRPDDGRAVYLLGHEEIQLDAERSYGPRRLADLHRRLHTWADSYRARNWPPDTPEYLLRGYYQLLLLDDDGPRLVRYATDLRRHHRMLDVTGGDTAALAEVTEAQNSVRGSRVLDLARLAVYRTALIDRNSYLPRRIPAVWAVLGHPNRAEQIARAVLDPYTRWRVLAEAATGVWNVGDRAAAVRLLDEAEQAARRFLSADVLASALVTIAGHVTGTGDESRAVLLANEAEGLVGRISGHEYRAEATAHLAVSTAESGDRDRAMRLITTAEALLDDVTTPNHRAEPLCDLVRAAAEAGDPDRAGSLADRAERTIRCVGNLDERVDGLARLAHAAAVAGDESRVTRLAREAAENAPAIANSERPERTMYHVASALARIGEHRRAEATAAAIPAPGWQGDAQYEISRALLRAGDQVGAERVARGIGSVSGRAHALADIASAAASAGESERAELLVTHAEETARSEVDPYTRATGLANLVSALSEAGEETRAIRAAREAERAARDITDPEMRIWPLATLLAHGHSSLQVQLEALTEQTLNSTNGAYSRAGQTVYIVTQLTEAGQHSRAEAIARHIADPTFEARALAAISRQLADSGQPDRARLLAGEAESVVLTTTEELHGALALADLVLTAARVGDSHHAAQLAGVAEATAHTIAHSRSRSLALGSLGCALGDAGELDRAERIVSSVPNLDVQWWYLSRLGASVARAGAHERAEDMAARILNPDHRGWILAELAGALAEAGDHARAEAPVR
ncbi:TIR domain-containing protein [Cryptosporangium arvum]|uniref:TIR domain-containing protein n=1 Tax=Cryptosporangium arvum DSM 44712 TaxID=927661 RepID=A0A010YS17_9ACTN|nr:TIR domain-containing protein [Cryptosporangium arvum]EXG83010.1 hypothetical protein CryarDRAFT_4217 [Cryptosporangium arvum DSM 44712]